MDITWYPGNRYQVNTRVRVVQSLMKTHPNHQNPLCKASVCMVYSQWFRTTGTSCRWDTLRTSMTFCIWHTWSCLAGFPPGSGGWWCSSGRDWSGRRWPFQRSWEPPTPGTPRAESSRKLQHIMQRVMRTKTMRKVISFQSNQVFF